jgi:hypothetical protein
MTYTPFIPPLMSITILGGIALYVRGVNIRSVKFIQVADRRIEVFHEPA